MRLLLILILSTSAFSDLYIRDFKIISEIKTPKSVVLNILTVKEGFKYTEDAKESILFDLRNSGLFNSINIITDNETNDSVTLNISMEERGHIVLSDIGGGIHNRLYGKETKYPWIDFHLAVTDKNFLYRQHKLTLLAGIWKIRYVGFDWQIPLKEKFYIGWGSLIGAYPPENDNWHGEIISNNKIYGGKKWKHHDLRVQASENFRRIRVQDLGYKENFWENILAINWRTRFINRNFNPSKGIKTTFQLSSNIVQPYSDPRGKEYKFLSAYTNLALFSSPFSNNHIFGVNVVLNNLLAGQYSRYRRKYIGGNNSLRGFPTGAYGWSDIFSNYAIATAEYRPHLWRIPSIKLKFMSWYDQSLKNFPVDIDGVLFIEGGTLWKELTSPLSPNDGHRTMASVGSGIRILLPSIEMSGSLDFAWPIVDPLGFYFNAIPALHLYVNLPF